MRPGNEENAIPATPGGEEPLQLSPRQARAGCGCLLFLGLLVLLLGLVRPYTDWLWFAHDARKPAVFATAYAARGQLFALAFVPLLIAFYFSILSALRVGMVYLRMPSMRGQQVTTLAIGVIQSYAPAVSKVLAVVIALIFALGFSNEWQTWLAYRTSTSFGMTDPAFGLDVGFFVFAVPWYLAVSNLLVTAFALMAAIAIGTYVGLQALAALASIELSRPYVRMHVSLLSGLAVVSFGVQLWLRRYEMGLADGTQFTGVGYAGAVRTGAQGILAIAIVLLGVGIIVNGRIGKPFKFTLSGAAIVGAAYVVALLLAPAVLQKLQVEPNKIVVERPFAARAIKMTRWAYGLDKVEMRNTEVRPEPTQEEIRQAGTTLENMRLWDPEVLRQVLDATQSLVRYYTFQDVDLDRYRINGKQTMVMLSPRDIEPEGLPPQAQSWFNLRLSYTHGYGIAMAPVNKVTSTGQPSLLIRDIPPKTSPELPLSQPRVYFSDFRDEAGDLKDLYALVNSGTAELDFPSGSGEQKTYKWTADRGVPIGGLLARLAYSISLGDSNLLISGSVTASTRLIYRRNVIERARLIYPFLRFDGDPYIVLLDGRIVWVLDGYTVSGRVPYSARVAGDIESLNYIRNPVKVTVDAYTGEATAYAIDPTEPILRTYMRVYPGLVRPLSELPPGLVEHFRYPEDMFNLQARQITLYHVTDPVAFLQNQDAWDVAHERDIEGNRAQIRPYYVQMKLPDEDRDGFMLILPFTPRQKGNMSGWLSAHSDPSSYGKLVLYRYQGQSLENIPGPEQMENRFNTDPKIAQINLEFGANRQSEIIVGNLLVIPIGRSVMYVEPLFLRSSTPGSPPIPELKKVILAFSNRISVADSYEQALAELLGSAAPSAAPPDSSQPGQPKPAEVEKGAIREVARLLDQAEAALRQGDFARYGELQRRARARLRELAGN